MQLPVRRETPHFAMPEGCELLGPRYDLVVIGGGLAGLSAAIQAARLGFRVCLVHNRPVLGGNFSSEVRMQIAGAAAIGRGYERFARETGIVEELGTEARWSRWHHRDVHLEPMQDFALLDMVIREPNIDLFLNAEAMMAVLAGEGRIDGVVVDQQGTERHLYVQGRFFVDASGDGRIAASAGAPYRVGREGREEYGESLAPDRPDSKVLGSSLMFWVRDEGRPTPFTPPEWAYVFPDEESLPYRHHAVGEPYWWLEWGGTLDTIRDNEIIRWELTRIAFGVWDHVKNRCVHREKAANYTLDWLGVMVGKRESRRFVGDHTLTQQDIETATLFPDRIAYGGWPIDLHPPEGIFASEEPAVQHFLRTLYSIPLRSCYSAQVPNLFLAGRLISASHVALGSTRVMGTCASIGQGVGAAAALCLRKGLMPRELAQNPQDLAELQQLLIKHDSCLIGVPNRDPADLGRKASVRASSQAPLAIDPGSDGEGARRLPLDGTVAQTFLVSHDRIDQVELFLEAEPGPERLVEIALYAADDLDDFALAHPLARAQARLAGGNRDWVSFRLDVSGAPGAYVIKPEEAAGIHWVVRETSEPAVRLARKGPNGWWVTPGAATLRLTPASFTYGPASVIDGVARPTAEGPHLWVSDPGEAWPQWVELSFDEPQWCTTVLLTFDTYLDHQNYRRRVPEPECVAAYQVLGQVVGSDEWVILTEVTGNYQRRRVHRFDRVQLRILRLNVLATNGEPSARVFEIRVYDDPQTDPRARLQDGRTSSIEDKPGPGFH